MFGHRPDGVLRTLYAELCNYAHSRAGCTNGDIWQSNGPVFAGEGFIRFWANYCDTLAACYVLAKICHPELVLPKGMRSVYAAVSPAWQSLGKKTRKEFFPK